MMENTDDNLSISEIILNNYDNTRQNKVEMSENNEKNEPYPNKLNHIHLTPDSYEKQIDRNLQSFIKHLAANVPHDWDKLSRQEKTNIIIKLINGRFPSLPDSQALFIVAMMIPGDCSRPIDSIPEWLDRDKFFKGQSFARDNLFGIFFAELLSLYTLFSFDDGLKPLIITGKSSEPYTAFKRYLSTSKRVRNWYTTDPFTKGTPAYNDINVVRRMHANVRNKLDSLTIADIDKLATIEKQLCFTQKLLLQDFQSSCPFVISSACPHMNKELRKVKTEGLSQGEMAFTQCGFICLVILYPEAFGIHNASDDDLEAFCHVWRGIGYMLGIDDEYNICRGYIDEIRQRSKDFLHLWVKPNLTIITPEWEHMMRCVTIGLQYYFPGPTYESGLLYLTELMGLKMPRLRSTMTYTAWIKHMFSKFILLYACKIKKIKIFLNRSLNRYLERASQFSEDQHIQLQNKSMTVMNKAINGNDASQYKL